MKIQFISYENLDTVKSNLDHWAPNFTQEDSEWLNKEFDGKLFSDTKFGEIPNFQLDMSAEKAPETDAVNARKIYENFKFLSDSQASDERLWAALCLGPFWKYVQYRWDISRKATSNNVGQHYFFAFGIRRSLIRNAIARLWWIGRLTYDESRKDPYELTDFICEHNDYIMHVLERNTSNNPDIVIPFLSAVIDAQKQGYDINTNTVGELAKYLNLLGGIYILDCLPRQRIYEKILARAREICKLNSVGNNDTKKDA